MSDKAIEQQTEKVVKAAREALKRGMLVTETQCDCPLCRLAREVHELEVLKRRH